jgi:3-keto-disaccharide hydrolase
VLCLEECYDNNVVMLWYLPVHQEKLIMQCTICGTTLRPEAAICPSCGAPTTYNPYDTSQDIRNYISQESSTNTVSTSPDSSSEKELQQISSDTDPSQEKSLTGNGLQDHKMIETLPNGSLDQTSRSIPQTPPNQQIITAFRNLSTRIIVLFVVLIVLIFIEGGGLVYYATAFVPHELRIQATAVARVVSTEQTQKTIQASATAAAITPQDIYMKSTSGNPVLTSLTSSEDGSTWEKVNMNGSVGTCNFTNGAYHIRVPSQGFSICLSKGSDFSNFAFQVQMTIAKGDVGGIIFRAHSADFKLYSFEISDGAFSLSRSSGPSPLESQTLFSSFSTAILPNQLNVLTVIAQGSNLYLYINGQPVAKVSDGTYSSGEIGVFAIDNQNFTDVIFSKAQVWKL